MNINYFYRRYEIFKKFIRENKDRIFLAALIDFLFYCFLALILFLLSIKINSVYSSISVPPDTGTFDFEIMKTLMGAQEEIISVWIYSAIIFSIAFIISSGIFKGMIWALVSKTKIKADYIIKCIAVNIMFSIPFFALASLFFWIMKEDYAVNFISLSLFFLFYPASISYAFLAGKKNIGYFENIREAIKTAFGSGNLFISYFIAAIVWIVMMSVLNSFIKNTVYSLFILIVFTSIYFAFWRYCITIHLYK